MPTFHIALNVSNIKVKSTDSGYFNVFQLTKPGTTTPGQYGFFIAAMFFRRPQNTFIVIADRNGKSRDFSGLGKDDIKIEETVQTRETTVFKGPFQFEFIQKQDKNGAFVITITMNGITVVQEINSKPLTVNDAELWVSYPSHPALDAEIHDFKLHTGTNSIYFKMKEF